MKDDEKLLMEKAIAMAEQADLRRIQTENVMAKVTNEEFDRNANMMIHQLDTIELITLFKHLLSGDIIKVIDGHEVWTEPEDDRLKILSNYGVDAIINILHFYINRDVLLSHFEEKEIYKTMNTFGEELNDLLFCKYEHIFFYPTPEDLFEKISAQIKANPNSQLSKKYIKDGKLNRDLLLENCIKWSREEMQSKLRHYPMLVNSICDLVMATFLRAMNGEERKSLRKQYNVHESLNPPSPMQITQSKFKNMFS